VMGRYLFLHFIPYPLVYYYGSYYIPTVSWANPIAIVSLVVYIAIGIWTLKELRKKSIIGFGLLFFLINIGAYSNLLQRAPGIMAERFTYAASLGFCVVIVALIFRFMKVNPPDFRWKSEEYKKLRFAIVAIALLFAVRTFWRTMDWKDKETLYGHDMEYLHESVKANMLYGALVSKHALEANMQSKVSNGQGGVQIDKQKEAEAMSLFTEARGYYEAAAKMAPYYHTAWSNLGTGYFFTGETRPALSYFLKAVSIKKDYAEGWFNVGMAYDKLEMTDSAVYGFSQSIKSDSNYVESYEQLSRLRMQKQNNPEEALHLLRLAARHRPASEFPWTNMASIYLQLKDSAHYESSMEMAAKINPQNLRVIGNLAQYYQKKGDGMKFNQYRSMAEALQRKQQEEQMKQQKKMGN
jgi:tetratricopeptide (TPR) repeat protein